MVCWLPCSALRGEKRLSVVVVQRADTQTAAHTWLIVSLLGLGPVDWGWSKASHPVFPDEFFCVCVCCVCVHMQARERQRERGVMKCKDTKEQEHVMSYFMSLSVTVLSLETCAIVLEAAAQWSGEVVLVECGEHDRCDLKAWICPAPFLCSHHLDCATLRVFNGLFPAIVFRCRAAIMQIRGHVIYRALMTRSNSRKLHESWLHIDIS